MLDSHPAVKDLLHSWRDAVASGNPPRGFPLAFAAAMTLVGCADSVEEATVEVVLTLPHDTAAYTQGLLFHERMLWESTGGWGRSALRQVDPQTGRVVRSEALPDSLFGEGLALAGPELVQLTWQAGTARVYDLETLDLKRELTYEGEGWGLCFDGGAFFMSNGSDSLYRRDRSTFAVLDVHAVTVRGEPVTRLNELECVGEHVWANVYQQDRLVQIEKATGRIVRQVDASRLSLLAGIQPDGEAVLNGIAYAPEADVFFLAGKLWPQIYVVRIVDLNGG